MDALKGALVEASSHGEAEQGQRLPPVARKLALGEKVARGPSRLRVNECRVVNRKKPGM
jgi:hypothetical protein